MGKPALFYAGLVLSLLLSACGGEAPVEESLPPAPEPEATAAEFALPYYPGASLHPIAGENRTNQVLSGLVYEPLFELDNTFEATPVLVRSWTVSEDGLTYTFELEEARFSDGSSLTAADGAASLDLARKSTWYAGRLRDITKIRAEEMLLTVTLARPNVNFTALLDIPIIREQEEGLPLGTGDYCYVQQGEELILRRQGAPGEGVPDTIPLRAIRGADDLIYAFDTNEVGLVTTDLTGSDALGYSGGYEIWEYPTTGMVYLGLQTQSGACAEVALRQAIASMVDRSSIVTALYARHAQEAALPVHPASPLYDTGVAQNMTYSPQRAADLLEQAGYKLRDGSLYYRGRAVKLELLVDADNSFRGTTADFLAEELGKLGVEVTVSRLSWTEFQNRLTAGTFDLYLAEALMTADFDPESLVGTGGSLNFGKWADEQTDLLLDGLRKGENGARRQLYQWLTTQNPIVPICFKNHAVLSWWGQVENLTPTRANPFAGGGWRLAAG